MIVLSSKIKWRLSLLGAKMLGKEKAGWLRVLREVFSSHQIPSINLKVEEGTDGLLKITFPDGVWLYWPGSFSYGFLEFVWRELNYPGGTNYLQFYRPSKTHVVLDVGACEGLFSLYLREKVHKLYLFEPIVELQTALMKTFAGEIKAGRITVEGLALWDKNGVVGLQLDKEALGGSAVCEAEGGYSVKAITLDSYVEEKGIQKIDLIKVDIEGAELKFLAGAKATLINLRPRLIICAYHNPTDSEEISLFLGILVIK